MVTSKRLILESLKSNGQWNNTVIVFSSDHGDMLGSQRFFNKETCMRRPTTFPVSQVSSPTYHGRNMRPIRSRVDLMLPFLELVAASSMDTNRCWPRFEWSEKDSGSMFTTLTVKMKSTYHPWSALTLQSGSSNGLQTRIKKGRDQPETENQQLYRWRGEFGKITPTTYISPVSYTHLTLPTSDLV